MILKRVLACFVIKMVVSSAGADASDAASCPTSNSDDYVSCAVPSPSPSMSSSGMCSSCTCNSGQRRLLRQELLDGNGGLRGMKIDLAKGSLLSVERFLQNKWGWDDCWAHYWCGFQEDVNLADTGLEPDIRARWENGGGAGGDGVVDDIKELICKKGIMAGRCSGGAEAAGKCQDQGLSRPPVSSPTYWIGGFGLDWKVTKTDRCPLCCKDTYTVKLTFNDAFDCNPGKYGLLVICGIAGPYNVKYEWEIKIECQRTCPPTSKPTNRPTTKPTPKPISSTSTSSTSSTYSSTSSTYSSTSSTYSSTSSTSPGTSSTYPGTSSTYPGTSSTYPGTSSTSISTSSTDAGTSSTYPGTSSTYPGTSSTYPGTSSTHASTSSSTYPGTSSTYHRTSSTYPGTSTSTYPRASSTYPGTSSTYPGTSSTYSGTSTPTNSTLVSSSATSARLSSTKDSAQKESAHAALFP